MQEEYESAVINKRWDTKRECYVNRNGHPVVSKEDIIFDDVLLRMKKNVDEMVNDLKKVAEDAKVEAVKVEDVKIDEEDTVEERVVKKKLLQKNNKLKKLRNC
ncbi:hypothetical protein Hanom_Chr08g00734401 [Helianthus anomalus]